MASPNAITVGIFINVASENNTVQRYATLTLIQLRLTFATTLPAVESVLVYCVKLCEESVPADLYSIADALSFEHSE